MYNIFNVQVYESNFEPHIRKSYRREGDGDLYTGYRYGYRLILTFNTLPK